MSARITSIGDVIRLVKDIRAVEKPNNHTNVYKYTGRARLFYNQGTIYYFVYMDRDLYCRFVHKAQVPINPFVIFSRWYMHNLILPTIFRLINENSQNVLLRIAIGMIYKLPISLKDKQTLYNNCIDYYKETKLEVDKQYYEYLMLSDSLPF